MSKTAFNICCFFLLTIPIFCCKKDTGTPDNDIYIVSASKLIGITGDDWANIEPQLSNKTGYWYTEFSQDQSLAVKAAISLPAIDDSDRTVHCKLLFNVARYSNIVRASVMGTDDSLSRLTKTQAYAMMLNYHSDALKLLTGISYSVGGYTDSSGMQINTTVDDVVNKLNNGFETTMIYIHYITQQGLFDFVVSKEDENNYAFGFSGYTN